MRVFTPEHIPLKLVEQIKDKHFATEDFYKYLSMVCLSNTKEMKLNPLCHLYVIVDEKKEVVGFVWFEIDLLEKIMHLRTFSMDPNYWYKGKAVKMLSDFMKEQLKKCGMKKIYWHTKYPKHSEKNGFRRSRNILMEYTEEVED